MTALLGTDIIGERLVAVFIFTLIVSGNFLGELFPCKIQYFLSSNMALKHFVGFLTLFFFGILTVPELNNLRGMLSVVLLYIVFLINSKTNYKIWIVVFVLYACLYVSRIARTDIEKSMTDTHTDTTAHTAAPTKANDERLLLIARIQQILIACIILFTIFGFILYIGEKKTEYTKQFNWVTFLFGKPKCSNDTVISENVPIMKALGNVFR